MYFQQSGIDKDYMINKVHKDFDKFLLGEKIPTFNQLKKIAKAFGIPVGLLLLSKPIEIPELKLNFRTIASEYLNYQSKELQDTIQEMKMKQEFLQSQISYELSFIGEFTIKNNVEEVANSIRKVLNLPIDYYDHVNGNEILNYMRLKINQAGIFVFFNGKVKDNTKRLLNVKEFRGFVLTDKKAPIIFINQRDTKNAQLFTLVHELVHLFIGESEIFGSQNEVDDYDLVETFVNKVTAELLVPKYKFLKLQKDKKSIKELANTFKVSEFVIIRRLFDNQLIDKHQYLHFHQQLLENYEKNDQQQKLKNTGGNYNHNLKFRIDNNFFKYVDNALENETISYTDAYHIIGVGYKGYKILK